MDVYEREDFTGLTIFSGLYTCTQQLSYIQVPEAIFITEVRLV